MRTECILRSEHDMFSILLHYDRIVSGKDFSKWSSLTSNWSSLYYGIIWYIMKELKLFLESLFLSFSYANRMHSQIRT